MPSMDPKRLKKVTNYLSNPKLSLYDEVVDLNAKLETLDQSLKETFGKVSLDKLEQLKGEPGAPGQPGPAGVANHGRHGIDGREGPIGKTGPMGPKPVPGVDFPFPKNGKDGVEITADQVRDKLQSLKDKKRLSVEFVQGVPTFDEFVERIKKDKPFSALDLKDGHSIVYPGKGKQDLRWHGSGVSKLTAGTGITIVSQNPDTPGMGNLTISATGTTESFSNNETPSGTINGVNLVFTTASTFITGSTHLYLNGLRQALGAGRDYTETGASQITFASAPQVGDVLIVDYQLT